jgi:anti-sigma regulatory factor (Ser/Thr protein kinase)/ribosomal protein S18 acetylase RimI-like enzyme
VGDERGASELERPIASVTVTADAELLPAVVSFVRRVAHRSGLRNKAAEHLDESVETVCRNVIEHAFGPDEEGKYDVLVLHRPGQIVIAVEDQGLPFDYARPRDGEGAALPEMLHRSFADEVRFINLGRGGNRVELVKHLPHADVRERLSEDEHLEAVRAAAAPVDTPVEIRMMRPEESFELSRCMYRCYGYSYLWDFVYYPERVRALQESGLMRSCVAVAQGNEFVGHLAVRLEHPGSSIGEAGQAVVDPRFRGHRLFERMMTFMAEHAKDRGLCGLYGEAIAVHPYSEKGFLHLGARETGFLLGYIPASVSFKEIDEDREGRRGSVALFYMRLNNEPERVIYLPHPYRDLIQRVVEHNGLLRTIGDEREDPAGLSRVSVEVHRDDNQAYLRVEEPGADLKDVVGARLRELCVHRVDCIYADLPLSHRATPRAGSWLQELGFFYSGVIPELRDGDVLRLEYLNNVEVDPADVLTASDFGRELLALIFRQKAISERQAT